GDHRVSISGRRAMNADRCELRTSNVQGPTFNQRSVGTPPDHIEVRCSMFNVRRLSCPRPLHVVSFVFFVASAAAAEPTKAQLDFFESKIRPIFADNCYKCHSPAKGKVKGELELDWKGGWEKGGEHGPAIVPGDPEKS